MKNLISTVFALVGLTTFVIVALSGSVFYNPSRALNTRIALDANVLLMAIIFILFAIFLNTLKEKKEEHIEKKEESKEEKKDG